MTADGMNQLCDIVRETGFKYHRHGHLEKIYENAVAHRLRKQGLKVEQQHPLIVYDEDGTVLGEYFAEPRGGGSPHCRDQGGQECGG